MSAWLVRTIEGTPRGGLYELEIAIRHEVVETATGKIVATFHGSYEAELVDGSWADGVSYGVVRVEISGDDELAEIYRSNGKAERVRLLRSAT